MLTGLLENANIRKGRVLICKKWGRSDVVFLRRGMKMIQHLDRGVILIRDRTGVIYLGKDPGSEI